MNDLPINSGGWAYTKIVKELDKFAIELKLVRLHVEHLNEDRKKFEKAYHLLMDYVEKTNNGQIDEDLHMELLELDL